MATAAQLQGRLAALLAAALVMFAPIELTWSRTAIAEVPSVAFGAAAMAFAARYVCIGNRLWLVLAALAMSCSILTKLFGLYTLPAVLILVTARWWCAPTLDRRAALRGFSYDLLIAIAISVAIIVLIALSMDLPKVWDQAVRFHWTARSSQLRGDDLRLILLHSGWAGSQIFLALAGCCIFCGWRGLALLTWPFFTFMRITCSR
jgi:dolichyl-phosphate-mannose--protein O-mannosyl transferase